MHVTLQPRSYRTTGTSKTPGQILRQWLLKVFHSPLCVPESLVFGTRERDRGANGACYSVQSTCYKCSCKAPPPTPHADCMGEGTEGFSSLSLGLDPTFISPYMRKKTWPQEYVLFGLGEKIGNQLKKKNLQKKKKKYGKTGESQQGLLMGTVRGSTKLRVVQGRWYIR